jgi:O-methyltransferase
MDFIFDKNILKTYFSNGFSLTNKTIQKFGLPLELKRLPDPGEMITIEQQLNLNHLVSQVLFYKVPGDLVELGCFTGTSAMEIGKIMEYYDPSRVFHVFDSFEWRKSLQESVKEVFIKNFKKAGLRLPVIHEGFFDKTLEKELPESIAFIHIDCGMGRNRLDHRDLVLFCLENIYNRLTTGAICLLMDYHDKQLTLKGLDMNPGVKMACDIFFKDKKEKVSVLYGNHYSHGYFRKLG